MLRILCIFYAYYEYVKLFIGKTLDREEEGVVEAVVEEAEEVEMLEGATWQRNNLMPNWMPTKWGKNWSHFHVFKNIDCREQFASWN